jgi:predicted transposase YbfD/YdcC
MYFDFQKQMELIKAFEDLEDPRMDRTKKHPLLSIVFLTIAAVVAGADSFTAVADFGKAKQDWLKKHVPFPEGVPSHDTIGDLFGRIKPEKFARCFIRWVGMACGVPEQDLINIDGKTLRGSHDEANGKYAIHLIHAYASGAEILLGQLAVAEKSNEITAIPDLLELIDVAGAMVTIDAMGCQKSIAQKVIEEKGDYLLAVKGNQGALEEEIKTAFTKTSPSSTHTSVDKGHGRVEKRICTVIDNLMFVDEAVHWKGIQSIIRVERERQVIAQNKETNEVQYYICSKNLKAEVAGTYVRSHWSIENKLHWTLDVTFNEDLSRIRNGHADENFAAIRRIALNLLKLNTSVKKSIAAKRQMAAWDEVFLECVLRI